ncbi:hypothetical protein U1701_09460 [Sphingomonas sp. PB2P19]|uniref:hypothetical protein n=1 Tax=Sphingomonas rhamnosi TaxID=3096156 RepID=UPI002FCA55FD
MTTEPEALTPAEQQRVSAVLAAVSTRTLLQSLARLNVHNADAGLIIAELLARLPAERDPVPV